MVSIIINFENASKFYFEGEVIKIKLEVQLQKPSTLNNVYANFVGVGVFLADDEKEDKFPASKWFSKTTKEVYFDDLLPIYYVDSKEVTTWSTGIHSFMFTYQLPSRVPTSIEATQGFVRHYLYVNADVDGEAVKRIEYFTVISKTNVNKDAHAHLPGILWKPENQCLLKSMFCKRGGVRAFFHIAKQGYVPGEYLYINAEISNFHRLPIEWVKATLVQVIKFSGLKTLKEKRIVTEITRGCVLSFETQTWRGESVLIPAIPPTTYPPKNLIQVKYMLLFHYKPSWLRKPVELKQKLLIGTVQLVGCEHEKQEQGQGEGANVYNSELFNNSNLEPCIFGPHRIEDDENSIDFSPLYPIYVEMQ